MSDCTRNSILGRVVRVTDEVIRYRDWLRLTFAPLYGNLGPPGTPTAAGPNVNQQYRHVGNQHRLARSLSSSGSTSSVDSNVSSEGDLIETDCSTRKPVEKPVIYSETFNNTCLTQGSEPASRDISPNNNTSSNTGPAKPGTVKQPRSWYKPPHRARYSKSAPQPQATTPTHSKRKRPVKYNQIKDVD